MSETKKTAFPHPDSRTPASDDDHDSTVVDPDILDEFNTHQRSETELFSEPVAAPADVETPGFNFRILDFVVSLLDSKAGNFRPHACAVARYSRVMAEQLKLPTNAIDEVVTAAYLHDLNKLLELKKKNQTILHLLSNLNAPQSLQQMIRHMGEKFDGTGEPDKLSGEVIPLGSRILAIANMFDEISRGKVDTQVIRRDAVFDSLKKRAGTYLDPKLVDLMIQGLQNEYRHFYKSTEARVLISIEEEDQRFNLSNLLMESGYSVRMSRGAEESFATLTEFSPHLMVLSVQHLQELVELCREKDFLIYKPVLVVGGADVANQVQVNDYIPIEDFIEIPVPPKQMIAKVEKIFEQVIRQEEKSREMALFFEKSENHSKAGEIYRELGDYRKAAEMFETADAYGAAGEMYELLEDPKRAAKAYEMAGDYIKAAYFYTEAGMYEDRGRVYEKTGDYYYTAKNKLFQNDPDQALTYFRKVEPSHEKYRKACYYMAKIYVQRKEWAQAVKFYEKIVADEPIQANNIRHYYNLALAYEYLKQDSEALAIYEKILGVDYNFRDVYKRIERLRKKLQQVDQRTKMEQKVADFASVDQVAASSRSARYEKVKVIGRGGMGVVYEATDQVLGRKVALKVLSAAFREDKLVIDTFLREAKAAAMLNHVNIVTIFDAGVEANNYFIAMEMINGNTLKEIIQDRRFSIASVLRIMRQVCSGLKYAHSKKIIHRDLTNSNIMLTKDNIVKIMDFGLARIVEHLMSEQSIIGGTPSYMAPEQVQGAPIDHRADIYAIGINLFELCTGRLPFTKGDMGFHHVHTTPPNPRDFNSKITSELSDVILKCLEKLPENRFQSVEELMHALKF